MGTQPKWSIEMSDPKHKEDISGLVIGAFIPTVMIAVWIFVSVLGLDVWK